MAQRSGILLIVGGGIAAYKSLDLVRELGRRQIGSRCILTRGGERFVTSLSLAALSGCRVHSDLFDADAEAQMGHIGLSRASDLIVVCPATADMMARCAAGIADDLATTALLATDTRVLMVPAMNVRMWQHPATRRAVERLRSDGVTVMEPESGEMACGEFGPGRLPEVTSIVSCIESMLDRGVGVLSGRRAIVTAGPTREPLDPVRYLSSESSGRQGYAIARCLREQGADVVLVSGPVELEDPCGIRVIRVHTAQEMLAAVRLELPADVFVGVAAVADWRPSQRWGEKMKLKNGGEAPVLGLTENPDILQTVATGEDRPELVVGFAAETSDVEAHAAAKRRSKGCDWIVANDVSGDVMGGEWNAVTLMSQDGQERWPRLSKTETARKLADRIAAALDQR